MHDCDVETKIKQFFAPCTVSLLEALSALVKLYLVLTNELLIVADRAKLFTKTTRAHIVLEHSLNPCEVRDAATTARNSVPLAH